MSKDEFTEKIKSDYYFLNRNSIKLYSSVEFYKKYDPVLAGLCDKIQADTAVVLKYISQKLEGKF